MRPLKFLMLLLVLVSTGLPTISRAAVNDEVRAAVAMVRDVVVKLDLESQSSERISLLVAGVEAVGVLQGFAKDFDSQSARTSLSDLAAEAITPDVLRLQLVEALAAAIDDTADGIKRDVEAKEAIATISDAAYRAAAWSALSRNHLTLGHREEAERIATRAIEDAVTIERTATRNGALRGAMIAFLKTGLRPALVGYGTDRMTSAAARSEVYQLYARAELKGEERSLKDDALANLADKLIEKGDLSGALRLIAATSRDFARRDSLLDRILDLAIARDDDLVALECSKSMGKDKLQDKAIRKMIDHQLETDRPLKALAFVTILIRPAQRVKAEIAISRSADRLGYRQVALQTLRLSSTSDLDEDGKTELVDALASLLEFDAAKNLIADIHGAEANSFARSRLAKRLADVARVDEAIALSDEIVDPSDKSFAQSSIARALAASGKTTEALQIITFLLTDDDRDRAWEAIAHAEASIARYDHAVEAALKIKDPSNRSSAFIAIASVQIGTDQVAARANLSKARDFLINVTADEQFADIAIAYAQLGDLREADIAVRQIKSGASRSAAIQRLVSLQVKKGQLDDVTSKLSAIIDPRLREQISADVAFGTFERDHDPAALIARIREMDFRVRVPVMRKMAEVLAKGLDPKGWLHNSDIDPISEELSKNDTSKIDFSVGNHIIKAPAPAREAFTASMPNIFGYSAMQMAKRVPAPLKGVAHVAVLGFSPFSLEAFKLSDDGSAAVHQLQLSQDLTWPRYIVIERGTVTLSQILRDVPEATERRLVVADGRRILVRVPIIVLPGANLVFSGAEYDQYLLSATAGAFIAVAGNLFIQNAEIIGFDEVLNKPAVATDATRSAFRPFITAWGGSNLQIGGSRVAMLGYDSSKAFGLTQSSGAAVQSYDEGQVSPSGQIVDNSFENLRYGYYSYETENVAIIGNEYRDNIIYGIDPHDRSKRLTISLNTVYGSQKKHGIIVSREVSDSFLVGNISIDNHGSGLMLDRTSSRNFVYANTASGNGGDGLTFYESGCNIAASNAFVANRRAGIKVRNSSQVGLYSNNIKQNAESGADIYVSQLEHSPEGESRNFELDPYSPVASTSLGKNLFENNGDAINVSGASEILLDRNQFMNERTNLFSGDFKPISPFLLQLGDDHTLLVTKTCRPAASNSICRFGSWSNSTQQQGVYCTGMDETPTSVAPAGNPTDG